MQHIRNRNMLHWYYLEQFLDRIKKQCPIPSLRGRSGPWSYAIRPAGFPQGPETGLGGSEGVVVINSEPLLHQVSDPQGLDNVALHM